MITALIRLAALATAAISVTAAAAGGSGYDLMQRSEDATKSRTEVTRYRLDLLDGSGDLVQSRDMLFHFKQLGGKEATVVRFTSPPAISGTGLLVEDSGQRVNDIWLYLPATRRLRRIAGAEKTNWFMGTEFTHEDFEDYQLPLYEFTRLESTTCASGPCTQVRAVANDTAERRATGYQAKIYYIDDRTLYPVRIDYIGKDGRVAKVFTATGLRRDGAYWRPRRIEMHNRDNGRRTVMVAQSRTLDGPLKDYRVSKRYLRADP
jgi:hypothetical protein